MRSGDVRSAGAGGREPASAGLDIVHEQGEAVLVRRRDRDLLRYVYRPSESPLEAPRPYFHPVRTLGGELVTLYRPRDHIWHKGVSWALSNVGEENFWGGPTYVRDQGYVQLDNDGTQLHTGFERLGASSDQADVVESLDWVTQAGGRMFTERRSFSVRVHLGLGAWQLAFSTEMTNVGGVAVSLGSPSSRGREAAGYSGLFWRGPHSFSGGVVLTPDGAGGEELMGVRSPWLGFAGHHDGAGTDTGTGTGSTVVFRDHESNYCHPTRWFVRSGTYAGVCPAPFFDTEHDVEPGATLRLRYDILVADGVRDVAGCARLAAEAGRTDLLAAEHP
ncbi:PmoA family protein [Microbispora sp. NPDC049125]|uniref:DUF6807 domain-containing protein n=1 Tax=Microbispora sp. NPDC049125 TaxID=3154929 RepID=UPI0034650D51